MYKKAAWIAFSTLLVLAVFFAVAWKPLFERDTAEDLTLYGNVDIRQVDLGFRVPGRIAAMHLEEGDWARAGQVVAELDTRPYQDDVRAAEAVLAQRKATLAELVHGPRPREIDRARDNLRQEKAVLARAELAFARAKHLRQSGANPQAALDDAREARDTAVAKVASAEATLRLLLEGTRTEVLSAGRADVDLALAQLASARTSLADAVLHAPSDGVVLSRVREPGAIVAPTDVVYVLSLTRPVWIRAYVSEPQLGRIYPGMHVEISSDTDPERMEHGRIGFISPVAEFTPKTVETPELRTDLVYRLRIIVDSPSGRLRQGMPVTVLVRTERLAGKD